MKDQSRAHLTKRVLILGSLVGLYACSQTHESGDVNGLHLTDFERALVSPKSAKANPARTAPGQTQRSDPSGKNPAHPAETAWVQKTSKGIHFRVPKMTRPHPYIASKRLTLSQGEKLWAFTFKGGEEMTITEKLPDGNYRWALDAFPPRKQASNRQREDFLILSDAKRLAKERSQNASLARLGVPENVSGHFMLRDGQLVDPQKNEDEDLTRKSGSKSVKGQ